MQFAIDNEIQSHLEAACIDILGTADVLEGGNDIKTKKPGDVLIQADIVCDKKYKETAAKLGVHYHSEETRGDFSVCEKDEILILADPIDGSSEFGRYGPRRTPIVTSALALRGTVVIGAVTGDLWNQTVYGLDAEGLYVFAKEVGKQNKQYIRLDEERKKANLKDVCVAAYTPNKWLMDLIYPGLYEGAERVCTNAGIAYALCVVEMKVSHAICASIETKPVDLFEHIGAIMASQAGAHVSRLDGTEFVSDPRHLQTSITATSKQLADDVWASVQEQYERAGMPHDVLADTPEAKPFQKS